MITATVYQSKNGLFAFKTGGKMFFTAHVRPTKRLIELWAIGRCGLQEVSGGSYTFTGERLELTNTTLKGASWNTSEIPYSSSEIIVQMPYGPRICPAYKIVQRTGLKWRYFLPCEVVKPAHLKG